jgi:hypothetical protein
MEANCMLYRANRLAPVALNLPDTCDAIREDLNRLISAFWESEPTTDVNFLVEADRFCRFLRDRPDLPSRASSVLAREHAVVTGKIEASLSVAESARWESPWRVVGGPEDGLRAHPQWPRRPEAGP